MAKFKQEVLEKMRTDADLFMKLTKALNIRPSSVRMTIDRNSRGLNQYHIVTLVADHLGKEPQDLLEEIEMKGTAA